MSYNKYDLDGIKAELRKELEEARAKLAAWRAVTFPTKKDGSPFKLMSKNIFEAVSKLNEAAGDRSTLRYMVYDTVINNCRYH